MTVIDLFNEILQSFRGFVVVYLDRLTFADGISVGWLLLAITGISLLISFLYGRFKA